MAAMAATIQHQKLNKQTKYQDYRHDSSTTDMSPSDRELFFHLKHETPQLQFAEDEHFRSEDDSHSLHTLSAGL